MGTNLYLHGGDPTMVHVTMVPVSVLPGHQVELAAALVPEHQAYESISCVAVHEPGDRIVYSTVTILT